MSPHSRMAAAFQQLSCEWPGEFQEMSDAITPNGSGTELMTWKRKFASGKSLRETKFGIQS